jgi:hypothetical protein
VSSPLASKFHSDEKGPFPLLRRILHRYRRLPRFAAATQSEIILTQANSFHPSVPEAEAEFGAADSLCETTAVGRESLCAWAEREITTVEIACLKISCS